MLSHRPNAGSLGMTTTDHIRPRGCGTCQHRSPSGDYAADCFRAMRKFKQATASRAAHPLQPLMQPAKKHEGVRGKAYLMRPPAALHRFRRAKAALRAA